MNRLFFFFIFLNCSSVLVSADSLIPESYKKIAKMYHIPAQVFYAIALQESKRDILKVNNLNKIRPWRFRTCQCKAESNSVGSTQPSRPKKSKT